MAQIIVVGGGGVMGSALIKGWKEAGLENDVRLIGPHLPFVIKTSYPTPSELHETEPNFNPDFIIFAVKPQVIENVLPLYRPLHNNCVFISIAAGIPISTLKKHLGESCLCVRVMPNLGATVRCSVSGLYTGDPLSKLQKDLVLHLFEAVGSAFWVKSEDQIDAVTAISGSGPGYVFRFIESLIKSAIALGFDHALAEKIAKETFKGAITLLEQGGTPQEWRQRVTSPGGTTAAALAVFEEQNLDTLMEEAVRGALTRARELGYK